MCDGELNEPVICRRLPRHLDLSLTRPTAPLLPSALRSLPFPLILFHLLSPLSLPHLFSSSFGLPFFLSLSLCPLLLSPSLFLSYLSTCRPSVLPCAYTGRRPRWRRGLGRRRVCIADPHGSPAASEMRRDKGSVCFRLSPAIR